MKLIENRNIKSENHIKMQKKKTAHDAWQTFENNTLNSSKQEHVLSLFYNLQNCAKFEQCFKRDNNDNKKVCLSN